MFDASRAVYFLYPSLSYTPTIILCHCVQDLLPTDGIVPLSHTFDTPGPLARSVMDSAIMFAAMMDRESGLAFERSSIPALDSGIEGMRIAYMGPIGRTLTRLVIQQDQMEMAVQSV